MREGLRWLVDPAVRIADRPRDAGLAALRILVGLMWLYNVAWKRPPDFGEAADNGLYHFTAYAVSDPVLPPYSWLVENLVLPHIVLFGYGVILAETALAVMLLTGTAVRAAAALGVVQSVAIALAVAFAPDEWPWSYWLMIGAHLVLLLGTAGRSLAVDAVRAGLRPATLLHRVWGTLAVVVGAFSALMSLGDPLAATGPGLRSTDLSVSLGQYNLVGGIVVLAAGALLLVASTGVVRAGQAAAILGVLGALSLHLQIGFSDPLLGGTASSAAFLLALTVVGLTTTTSRKNTR